MSASEVVGDKEGNQNKQEIQSHSSQPDITLENRGAASVEDLESSEKQKNKEIQKRSSSTPEIKVSQDDANGQKNIEPHHSLLSELLSHLPIGGSDYQTSADSVVHNILADVLAHMPVEQRKSGESVARSTLSDLLSHLSSEVAAHKVSLDCEYLKEQLGAPLALGLCEVVIKRPVDPIHYLAHWLFKWRWNQQQKEIREEEINALNLERQKKLAELKEKERIETEQQAILELKKQASEAATTTLEAALSQAFELISQEGEEEEEGETAAETEEGNAEGV